MTYKRFLENLNARGMFRIHPDLDRVTKVMRELGNAQNQFPSIHIAGTNGKGSVASGLESVLTSCGYRTGLYTSPHLKDLRERIKIDGLPLVRGFTHLAEDVLRAERRAKAPLTYFELLTAVAFHAFAKRKVDIAIVECGLGGLWDATNVIEKPLMSIVTSIGLEHTQWLGHTERQIAIQKAGIIKKGSIVISGARGAGQRVIEKIAREKGCLFEGIEDQFAAESLTSSWRSGQQIIRYKHRGEKATDFAFGLLGSHQVDNAALIQTALAHLRRLGCSIPIAKQEFGLRRLRWPGRLQFVRSGKSATILLDGAHNPPAMKTLAHFIESSIFANHSNTLIFSSFKDKDYSSMARMISPSVQRVFLCPLRGSRAAPVRFLRPAFARFDGILREFSSVGEALRAAKQNTPADALIVVTGSLSLVGEALRRLPLPRKNNENEAVRSHV